MTMPSAASADYPVHLGARPPERLSTGLWLVKWLLIIPHAIVLIPLWETIVGGTWNSPDQDVDWTYQADIVGFRTDQLEWARDKVKKILLERDAGQFVVPIDVDGMRVMTRTFSDENTEPQPEGALLTRSVRFVLRVTPASAPTG